MSRKEGPHLLHEAVNVYGDLLHHNALDREGNLFDDNLLDGDLFDYNLLHNLFNRHLNGNLQRLDRKSRPENSHCS